MTFISSSCCHLPTAHVFRSKWPLTACFSSWATRWLRPSDSWWSACISCVSSSLQITFCWSWFFWRQCKPTRSAHGKFSAQAVHVFRGSPFENEVSVVDRFPWTGFAGSCWTRSRTHQFHSGLVWWSSTWPQNCGASIRCPKASHEVSGSFWWDFR